jgi:hypothetical protein
VHGRHRPLLVAIIAACAFAPAAIAQGSILADAGGVTGLDHPLGVAVLDADLDGHQDVVAAGASAATLLRGQGAFAFAPAASPLVATGVPWAVAAGDLDDDGHDDAVVLSQDGTLRAFLSRAGGPQAGSVTALGAGAWTDVALADVNRDNKVDAIATDEGGGFLAVALGTGAGGFGAPDVTEQDTYVGALAVADFNRDGAVDVVALDRGDAGVPAVLTLLLGTGDGTFAEGPNSPLELSGEADDVVLGGRASSPYPVVADGDATRFNVDRQGQLSGSTPLSVPGDIVSAAMADLDGDFVHDDLVSVAQTGASTGALGVNRQEPTGEFTADTTPLALGGGAGRPVIADLDGNSAPDVVVPETTAGAVRILRNTLAPAPTLSATSLVFVPANAGNYGGVTVRNAGTFPFTVAKVELLGADAARFRLVNNICGARQTGGGVTTPVRWAPGDSCAIGINTPAVVSNPAYAATLRITTSAGVLDVALTAAPGVMPQAFRPLPITPAIVVKCTVPKLKGLTLAAATKRLKKAHCALGKVRRPPVPKSRRARAKLRRATLVVATQAVKAGTRRTAGAKVGLRLVVKPARKQGKKRS